MWTCTYKIYFSHWSAPLPDLPLKDLITRGYPWTRGKLMLSVTLNVSLYNQISFIFSQKIIINLKMSISWGDVERWEWKYSSVWMRDAGLSQTFSASNPYWQEEIKSGESKHISTDQNKWSNIFSLQFSLELQCSSGIGPFIDNVVPHTNLWRALDFIKKGGEMESRAGGGGRVFLKGLLHTM